MPFIYMEHPSMKNSKTKVDEGAFNLVWKEKGWVRFDDVPKPKKKSTKKPKTTVVVESTDESEDTLP